jgi:hypothetical protein
MEVGKELFYTQFGSHVYGTNVPGSDLDYKGIFIPSTRDILLQQANHTSINRNTNPDPHAKNATEDIDIELFTLQGFLRLCKEGQTVAVDMLFSPTNFWKVRTPEWDFIIRNRDKLIHKGVSAFVGYCQTQAAKYGIKGSRIASVRSAVEFLDTLPRQDKLLDHWGAVKAFVAEHQSDKYSSINKQGKRDPFIKITQCKAPHGRYEDHFEVNNRKIPRHGAVKYAKEIFQKILDNYGQRALKAEQNEGIDWKALMHAVRVCEEAKELLMTGFVTFPRPERKLLLDIRKGNLPYKEVARIIEEGVQSVDLCQEKSSLPLSIDEDFWEQWLLDVHFSHVMERTEDIDSPISSDTQICCIACPHQNTIDLHGVKSTLK